jgi:hypothetical protein
MKMEDSAPRRNSLNAFLLNAAENSHPCERQVIDGTKEIEYPSTAPSVLYGRSLRRP